MKTILVIGDSILDHYVYGTVRRMSPEDARIPVVDFEREEYRLGGCLNVAANLKSLRPKNSISVTSVIDPTSSSLLVKRKIKFTLVRHSDAMLKTRVIDVSSQKQLLRLDNKLCFSEEDCRDIHAAIRFLNLTDYDAIVISDYCKGIISTQLIAYLANALNAPKSPPVFIDTKKKDLKIWKEFKRAIIKINFPEYSLSTGKEDIENLVVTCGKDGAILLRRGAITGEVRTDVCENPEVTGAGDVFLAGLVSRFLEKKDLPSAVRYANMVAGKSVRKFGTVEVTDD